MGIKESDAEKEAEKRAARAKRFGLAVDDETAKKDERAKKFGLAAEPAMVKGLDAALPERRPKRGREGADKQGDRAAKRPTPDRRTGPVPAKSGKTEPLPQKKPAAKILDDPAEKAKAEARAKRFQTAA